MSRAVAADVKATGRDRTVISKAATRSFFSRVSEATLGSFPGHFWSVLGTKLGGVSAFRVVSINQAVASCKVARLKVSKRWDATGRLSQSQPKDLFFQGFQSNVRQFSRSLLERFGHEIRWRFSVSSGVHESSCCS